ncbi:hypothetical protein CGU37_27870, partial [Pseudomonas fluorescens]
GKLGRQQQLPARAEVLDIVAIVKIGALIARYAYTPITMRDKQLLGRFLQEFPPFRFWGIERMTFRVETFEAVILKCIPKVGGGVQSWTIGFDRIMEGFRPIVGLQPDASGDGIGPEETDARTQKSQFFQALQQRGSGKSLSANRLGNSRSR